jgi:hypothetical protein
MAIAPFDDRSAIGQSAAYSSKIARSISQYHPERGDLADKLASSVISFVQPIACAGAIRKASYHDARRRGVASIELKPI